MCVYYLWVYVCTDSAEVLQNDDTFICRQLAECWTRSGTPAHQRETEDEEGLVYFGVLWLEGEAHFIGFDSQQGVEVDVLLINKLGVVVGEVER